MEPVNCSNITWKTASFSTELGYNDISLLLSGHRISLGFEKTREVGGNFTENMVDCRSRNGELFELPSQHGLAAYLQGLQQTLMNVAFGSRK